MSKSKIRLHYWNGRGRAEPIRFALAAANLEFENAVVSEVSVVVDFARRFFLELMRRFVRTEKRFGKASKGWKTQVRTATDAGNRWHGVSSV